MIKTIFTENAPSPIGPYSQGKIVGGMAYFAGQGGVIPGVGVVEGGIRAETEQACKNIGALLEAAGTNFDNVVEVTCFLADMADFAAFNEVYEKYFTSKPARTCVAAKELPKETLCEIKVVASVG